MANVTLKKNISFTNAHILRSCFDLYIPDDNKTSSLVIYFYGGSLKKGHKESQTFPRKLAEQGIAVACPDYRLIPEVKYPVFIEDAALAVSVILEKYKAELGKIKNIYIGGHSAGAYLSMMLCFDGHYLGKYGISPDIFAGYLFISGQPTKHMSVLECEGRDKREIVVDKTSALYHIKGHGSPLLIVTSDADLPCRREQNMLMYATLKAFNYDSPISFVNLGNCAHGEMMKTNEETGAVPAMKCIMEFIQSTAK